MRTWDFFGSEIAVVDTRRSISTLLAPAAVLLVLPLRSASPASSLWSTKNYRRDDRPTSGQPHPSINPTFCTGYRSPLAHWGALHIYEPSLIFFLLVPARPGKTTRFVIHPDPNGATGEGGEGGRGPKRAGGTRRPCINYDNYPTDNGPACPTRLRARKRASN